MKLNLGAADRAIPGFLSVDIVPPADVIADLTQPWDFVPESSVDEVAAYDVFEHLPNKTHTMNELWRVLKPGGIATIGVPDASEGDGADCDPTHVSRWNRSTFEYFERGNFARERFRNSTYYGVKADFKILNMTRLRHERTRGGVVYEIQVQLEALK